jgi:hypothetical protein
MDAKVAKENLGNGKRRRRSFNRTLIFLPNLSFAFFASVAVKGVASETGLAEC